MPAAIRPLIAGNWKMNGLKSALGELRSMAAGYDAQLQATADLLICPPATLLAAAATAGGRIAIGGQDCHPEGSGAHTGDISAEMLADAGATYVIVGHSERRADHGESDAMVRARTQAAFRAGLTAIVCIGETETQRRSGQTLDVVAGMLDGSLPETWNSGKLVIAYEPVWAIGTGLTPTPADIAQVHGFIRARLRDLSGDDGAGVRILYGGSVKPANAAELMAIENVNGALVGGASLAAADFLAIASTFR